MRGMPFDLPGKGALEAVAAQFFRAAEGEKGGTFWSGGAGHKRKKGETLEPRSVLDHRRSPSPPTSTSTLSSSLGGCGSGASTDTAGVAAVSHNLTDAGGRKEECSAELKSIMGSLAADEWETMISESAASPGQEQTFLRWIMGDIDDPSKHQHHQQLQQHQLIVSSQFPPVEFGAGIGGLGFGLTDPGFGFEPIGGIGGATPVPAFSVTAIGAASPLPASSGFSQTSSISFRNSRSSDLSQLPCGKDAIFVNPSVNMIFPPLSLPPAMFLPEPSEEKRQLFAPNLPLQLQQQTQTPPNPSFFLPLPTFSTAAPEQHQDPNLFLGRNYSPPNQSLISPQLHTVPSHLQQRPMRPKHLPSRDEAAAAAVTIQQQQALVDQLFKAAEHIEAGNFVGAHGILARLNHQLPSPIGKPLLRSAYYFKEALILLLANSSNLPPEAASSPSHHHRTPFTTSLVTPLDVVLKLSASKAFSEVSPFLHFTSFTVTQTLLEELGTAGRIHIIDFDLGVGGQWSSFMQELAQRPVDPLLKITAFVSPCAFHPLELNLIKDNLSQFAADLKISFEINILSMESFDPAEILAVSASSNEAIAVNLPAGAGIIPSFSTLLRFVKQLRPKIVVMVDQGCDRSDLSFSHHFLHAFQSSMTLLDSIDAAGSNLDMANKIERFVLQPRIENCIIGRHRAAEKMLPWRTLFASAGFVPVQFSSFAETLVECLLKRVHVRGFHAEKRHASLCLYWQQGELVSVSAWRC